MFRGKLPCYDPALSCHHIHLLSINSRRFAMAYRLRHSTITFASHPTNASHGWLQWVRPVVETRDDHSIPLRDNRAQWMLHECMHPAVVAASFGLFQVHENPSFRVNVPLSQLGLVAQSIFPASSMLTYSI